MSLKTNRSRAAILIILTSALAAGLSGCRGAKPVLENVIVRDTVVVTQTRTLIDTLELFKDTVIFQDRVKLELEYRDRFVKVKVDCPSDTIRLTQTKIITRQAPSKDAKRSGWILYLAILLGMGYFVKRLIDKWTA
jgi:hypothetical protein